MPRKTQHTRYGDPFTLRTTVQSGVNTRWDPIKQTQEQWLKHVYDGMAQIGCKTALRSMDWTERAWKHKPEERPAILEKWDEDDWELWRDVITPNIAKEVMLKFPAKLPDISASIYPLTNETQRNDFYTLKSTEKQKEYLDKIYKRDPHKSSGIGIECSPVFCSDDDTVYMKYKINTGNAKDHTACTSKFSLEDGSFHSSSPDEEYQSWRLEIPDFGKNELKRSVQAFEQRMKAIDQRGTQEGGPGASMVGTTEAAQEQAQKIFHTLATQGRKALEDDVYTHAMATAIEKDPSYAEKAKAYRKMYQELERGNTTSSSRGRSRSRRSSRDTSSKRPSDASTHRGSETSAANSGNSSRSDSRGRSKSRGSNRSGDSSRSPSRDSGSEARLPKKQRKAMERMRRDSRSVASSLPTQTQRGLAEEDW